MNKALVRKVKVQEQKTRNCCRAEAILWSSDIYVSKIFCDRMKLMSVKKKECKTHQTSSEFSVGSIVSDCDAAAAELTCLPLYSPQLVDTWARPGGSVWAT